MKHPVSPPPPPPTPPPSHPGSATRVTVYCQLMDLRVEASAVGSVLADALSPRHIGAERFRVVVKAVDEGREQRRLLQRRGRVCQCESNRAGGREHRFLPTSATNQ